MWRSASAHANKTVERKSITVATQRTGLMYSLSSCLYALNSCVWPAAAADVRFRTPAELAAASAT